MFVCRGLRNFSTSLYARDPSRKPSSRVSNASNFPVSREIERKDVSRSLGTFHFRESSPRHSAVRLAVFINKRLRLSNT